MNLLIGNKIKAIYDLSLFTFPCFIPSHIWEATFDRELVHCFVLEVAVGVKIDLLPQQGREDALVQAIGDNSIKAVKERAVKER